MDKEKLEDLKDELLAWETGTRMAVLSAALLLFIYAGGKLLVFIPDETTRVFTAITALPIGAMLASIWVVNVITPDRIKKIEKEIKELEKQSS